MFRAVVTILFCFSWLALAQTPPPPSSTPIPGSESSEADQQPALPQVPPRSFVYQAQSREAIFDYQVNGPTVRWMVDELLKAATGEPTVASAWNSLVKPSDIVGIKVCANGAPLFSTHPAVVAAIVAGLMESGLPAENIIVWDREEQALKVAGYRVRGGGYRLMWSEGNYDANEFITSPIAGQLIYGDLLFLGKQPVTLKQELDKQDFDGEPKNKTRTRHPARDNLSDRSHISRVLTRTVTKVINVPVLSDNVYCGLSGALFNMTVQNLDNWRRLAQPPESGDPSIPEAYADPRISGKVVLNIMDGLVALYAGGPIGNTNYAIQYGTLYCSKDPVSLDALAVRKIDQWRLGSKLNPVSNSAKWLQTSFLYGLGNSDLNRIEVRDVR